MLQSLGVCLLGFCLVMFDWRLLVIVYASFLRFYLIITLMEFVVAHCVAYFVFSWSLFFTCGVCDWWFCEGVDLCCL